MKRWVGRAARLYPKAWRRRYAAEFEALLEDATTGWRDLADVLRGALIMQMTNWKTFAKAAVVAGIAGAIVGGGASYLVPERYESVAVMRVGLRAGAPDARARAQERVNQLEAAALSRSVVTELILDPSFDLYRKERQRTPIEEVAERMRRSDIRVQPLPRERGVAFAILFAYPDRYKAQQVTREIVSRFMQAASGPDSRKNDVELLDSPNLPDTPVLPNRRVFTGLGLIIGLVGTILWRWPRARRPRGAQPA